MIVRDKGRWQEVESVACGSRSDVADMFRASSKDLVENLKLAAMRAMDEMSMRNCS